MKNKNEKNERIFVPAFNKYLDELTIEEWQIAANSNCGLDNNSKSNC